MDEMEVLEIKGNEDKIKVAGVLIANGYTVRIVTIKEGNQQRKSVLQYKKNEKH